MRLTKRQLKRIIREEYTRLKRQGLIFEGEEQDPAEETEDEYYDRLAAEYEELEDGRYEREDSMYRKQIGESRRRRIREGRMKELYGDIQNEILYIGQEQGGELVVQDVIDYLQNYANDPLGDARADYASSMSYEEVLQIMFDMVDAGMLTGGYEDFFDVHPDYM